MMKMIWRVFLLLNMFLLGAITAQAKNPSLDETLTLRLGPFWANMDATVNVFGQDLTVDESLDVSDVDFSVYGLWRITPRWRLEASYSAIDKSSSDTLPTSVNLGSVTIPAGLTLSGSFETSVARLALGYAIMRDDSYEFGVDLGVNFTSVKESFLATVPGAGMIADVSSIDVDEPLPTIGLFYNYAFSESWYLTTRAGLFALEIGDIDGTIFDLFGGIEYRPWKHVGIGFAYTNTSADITITSSGDKTDIEYDYNGPLLYAVFGF